VAWIKTHRERLAGGLFAVALAALALGMGLVAQPGHGWQGNMGWALMAAAVVLTTAALLMWAPWAGAGFGSATPSPETARDHSLAQHGTAGADLIQAGRDVNVNYPSNRPARPARPFPDMRRRIEEQNERVRKGRISRMHDLVGRCLSVGEDLSREHPIYREGWRIHTRALVHAGYGDGTAAWVFPRDSKHGELLTNIRDLLRRESMEVRSGFDPSRLREFDRGQFQRDHGKKVEALGDDGWVCPYCEATVPPNRRFACSVCKAQRAGAWVFPARFDYIHPAPIARRPKVSAEDYEERRALVEAEIEQALAELNELLGDQFTGPVEGAGQRHMRWRAPMANYLGTALGPDFKNRFRARGRKLEIEYTWQADQALIEADRDALSGMLGEVAKAEIRATVDELNAAAQKRKDTTA
jgi:hypothetical protein